MTTTTTNKLAARTLLTGLASAMIIGVMAAPAFAGHNLPQTMHPNGGKFPASVRPTVVSARGNQGSVASFAALATPAQGFAGEAHPQQHPVHVSVPHSLSADERMAQNQSGSHNGVSPNVVIGSDNRVRVTNTSGNWARQTVLIYSKVDGWCTGFLIGPDTVATAAHCVYHHEAGKATGWWDYQHETVYPGYNGSTAPYGTCSVKNLYTNQNWVNVASNWDYDYAAIKLNCTIGNSLGWYGYQGSGYSTATTLYTQGFPSDKTPTYSMWFTSGNVTGTRGVGQLLTNIDIIAGQSGSPVYLPCTGGYCAVGIVSWSPTTGGSANGLNRINANSMALFAQVKAA